MRLTKTSRVAAAAFAALALAATACGGNNDTGSSPSPSDTGGSMAPSETGGMSETPTASETGAMGEFTTIKDGTLTACSDIPYKPFEYEDNGEITGFDMELMQAIADDLGLTFEPNAIGFDPIQSGTALSSNQCDVAASAITITEERKANLDFSDPYYDAKQSLLTLADSGITTLTDLSGKALGVQSATTGEQYARDNAPSDADITAFENPGDLFTALQANQIQAVLQDLPVNADYARNNDNAQVVETYDTGEQYGFAVKKGNTALLDAINGALQDVRDSGTYDTLYNKYFGTE
jgi:polar amino acid transport system substrate-binding protein